MHRQRSSRRLLRRVALAAGISSVALLLGLGFIVHQLSGAWFAADAPDLVEPLAIPEIRLDGTRSPILDLSIPGEIRAPLRPNLTIALTFDDGPDPVATPALLEVLDRHGAKATFFMLGARAMEHPDLVRAVLDGGHDVGNHTFSHPRLSATSTWRSRVELALSNVALARAGATSRILRLPYSGGVDQLPADELAAARASGHLVVLSDLIARDWEERTVDDLLAQVTPVDDIGRVITFHDGGGDRTTTVEAVDRLLTDLGTRGFQFVTVSRFAGLEPGAAMDRPTVA
jgi:peptidoglycan/xylan/chitin deacetylase (PgdA/CDA1 family)